jgi:hypothetical protein
MAMSSCIMDSLPDAFEAILAQNEEVSLVTRYAADFKKVPDLQVVVPYHL